MIPRVHERARSLLELRTPMVDRVSMWVSVLGVLTACAGEAPVYDPSSHASPPSKNPIDVAIWPRMIADGTTDLVPASTAELCRRVSLDLIGIVPTAQLEASLCTGKTPEQIVRAFLAHPRFVEVERRFWIRRIGADPTTVMADHLDDADRILDAAAAGELGYDDLAAALLAHPILTINRAVAAGNDVTTTVERIFDLFLGRLPSPAEVADYANLLRPWRRTGEGRYDAGYAYYPLMAQLVPWACKDPVLGATACTSTLLGPPTTIAPQVAPLAPPGYEGEPGYFYYEAVHGTVPAALQTELEKPGRLLAERAEFWDEAGDMALARFVGWWRSTPNEPDSVLPEVHRALGAWFRAHPTRDLRELYVTVMTSVLYTTSAELPEASAEAAADPAAVVPPWTTGPTKLLDAHQLLDSVAVALERELGLCDPHTDEPVGRDWFWPDRLRIPQPEDNYGFGPYIDFYRENGVALGGCLGPVLPTRSPGLPALLTHIELSKTLCKAPSKILPAGLDPTSKATADAQATATYLYGRFLSRTPVDAERDAITTAASACFADTTACGDVEAFATELCGALIRSSAFLYY